MDENRMSWLLSRLEHCALSNQRCDITLFSSKPKIDVKMSPRFSYALMYGGGAKALKPLLEKLELSDGSYINALDIWTINPMPNDGLTQEDLSSVDLAEGDQEVPNTGRTMREIIRETYKCENEAETEHYLRRFLAS